MPDDAGMVSEPDTKSDDPVDSANFKVYPAEAFVLMVTVSLAIVWTPVPFGVTSTLTVPLVVNTPITAFTWEIMVVLAVAAPAATGASTKLNRLRAKIAFLYLIK